MNPFPEMLEMMCARGIDVVIGADAHIPQRVGEGYLDALALLERCGYDRVAYFVDRQRRYVAIADAVSLLAAADEVPTRE